VPLVGTRTYVGFGFGPIQAGLFLHEAFASGNFRRLVVAEVLREVVSAVRQSEGRFWINIAHADHIEHAQIGPVEIEDPASEADRQRLIEAVAEAEEIATAVPSVQDYASGKPSSIHRILGQGLRLKAVRGGPRAVVYTAENHTRAAEILEANVLEEVPKEEQASVRSSVRFINTAIGKMSRTVSDPQEIRGQGLSTITDFQQRAFLVESFNRILISKIHFEGVEGMSPFRRCIEVFEEKEDLLPFEEAKLYGHNATHAMAAYIGSVAGVEYVADLQRVPGVLRFLRDAFIRESGAALVRKYAGADPLFTPEGYRRYVDDVLARMINPYLRDTVQRVSRDPERKLGWDDRLIGTMRMALGQDIEPYRYGFGAAAALTGISPSTLREASSPASVLRSLWCETERDAGEEQAVLRLIEDGRRWLNRWVVSGFDRRELER
jgi:mannitol-1-phosphate 5-dehydrogenase